MSKSVLSHLPLVLLALVLAVACTRETVKEVPVKEVVTQEVVREVPVEKVVEVEKETIRTIEVEKPVEVIKEVVREVRVPGETVVVEVEKEVIREVKVPGETVVVEVEKQVIKEVPVEVVKFIEVEKAPIKEYSEAPMLAQSVAAGLLPPVNERLPEDPWIIPVEEVGVYGGSLHRAYLGPSDFWTHGRVSRTAITRFTTDGSGAVPSVVSRVESSPDGKTFTFYLRKGIKWSDGMPLTTEDFRFFWEDFLLDDDVSSSAANLTFSLAGQLPEVEILDEYTWSLTYQSPNYALIKRLPLTDAPSQQPMLWPSHWAKQFHARYADPDTLAALVTDAGFDDWTELWDHKFDRRAFDLTRPTLDPWVLKNTWGAQRVVAERNPYYWAVDPAGNQLPYIDRLVYDLVESADVIGLKAIAGEIDMQGRHINLSNYPVLQENAEKGNYSVHLWPEFGNLSCVVYINLTWPGPEGEFFRNVDFRRGLSVAVDRDSINETVYLGQAVPRANMPPPGHPEHPGPDWEKKWAFYDTELANKLLDDAGLTERDGEGWRLMPDGNRMSPEILVWEGFSGWLDCTEQVIQDWEAVGIKATMKSGTRGPITTEYQANRGMMFTLLTDTAGFTFVSSSANTDFTWPYGGPLWMDWLTSDGEEGERPPDYAIEINQLHKKGATVPPEEANEIAHQIYEFFADQVLGVPIVGMVPVPMVVSNRVGNFQEFGFYGWPLRSPSNGFPEKFFLRPG